MLFNSFEFMIFFPIVTGICLIVPKESRCAWLLVASYYFYMGWNPKYAILIAVSTMITFASGLLIEAMDTKRGKQFIAALSFVSNLSILAVFKYANFALQTVNATVGCFGWGGVEFADKKLDLLLPVGISFYTFQALSYTIDVCRGSIKAEKNITRYALFVSFFPQLVAGPIERSGNLLRQIQQIDSVNLWDFERIRNGLLLMFWGLFQKLVIADRAAILVNQVYNSYQNYGFVEIAIATVLFAFQIYCDFGGYSNIARGAAQVMGFALMQNFRQPYFAVSVRDFWRRWHISLTSWFTDYLYIPLGGSWKGMWRKFVNIFIVFVVSGLWHGASWHFVAWGIFHAVYLIAGDIKDALLRKLDRNGMRKTSQIWKMGGIFVTFILVDFAWIFFVSGSLHHVYGILRQIFTAFRMKGIYEMGLNRENWIALCCGVAVLLAVDIMHEKGISVFAAVNRLAMWSRWVVYMGLIWGSILFGIYGTGYDAGQFIYFQF